MRVWQISIKTITYLFTGTYHLSGIPRVGTSFTCGWHTGRLEWACLRYLPTATQTKMISEYFCYFCTGFFYQLMQFVFHFEIIIAFLSGHHTATRQLTLDVAFGYVCRWTAVSWHAVPICVWYFRYSGRRKPVKLKLMCMVLCNLTSKCHVSLQWHELWHQYTSMRRCTDSTKKQCRLNFLLISRFHQGQKCTPPKQARYVASREV